jgi:hypothetical protein
MAADLAINAQWTCWISTGTPTGTVVVRILGRRDGLVTVLEIDDIAWLFFGSLEADMNNALASTLLANCRIQGLDPEDYLVEVLRRLPSNGPCGQAEALTPRAIAAKRRAAA